MRLTRPMAAALLSSAAMLIPVVSAVPAYAQAPRGLSDTVRIGGNYDTGTAGPWASLQFERTVRIEQVRTRPTRTRPGSPTSTPTPTATSTVTPQTSWVVKLSDTGTFRTLRGKKSPGAGVVMNASARGTFSGSYAFTVVSATPPSAASVRNYYNYRCNMNGTGNRAVDCAGMPSSTSDWPKLYFPTTATVTPGAWRWEYKAPCDRWVNGSAGSTGDITGKGCPKVVWPTEPVLTQPSCRHNGTVRQGAIKTSRVRGVQYAVDGQNVDSGATVPVSQGRHVVKATALDGYVVKPRVQTSWRFRVVEPRCRHHRR
jgi:uncharacterized Zn-binding protein involved in type VI secretion